MEKRLEDFLNNEGRNLVEAICSEYCFLCIVKSDNTYHPLIVSDEFESIVKKNPDNYELIRSDFCEEFVKDKYRKELFRSGSIDVIIDKLKETGYYETIFQLKDQSWMGIRCYEILRENGSFSFLLGMIKFDEERQENQKQINLNEIVKAFAEEINIIYRVNVITYEFEIVLMNMENPEYGYVFSNFLEMEQNYEKFGIEEEFVESIPGEDASDDESVPEKIRVSQMKEYFDKGNTKITGYYREKSGRWMKLVVTPEYGYSEEYPYVIYAVSDCGDEINKKFRNSINKSAISRMYCLVATLNKKDGVYECIHCKGYPGIINGRGNLEDFINVMKSHIYSDDFYMFERLINNDNTNKSDIFECEYRIEDSNGGSGRFHYHNAFVTNVDTPYGKNILLLVQNVDERAHNRSRFKILSEEYDRAKNVLYVLGNPYFGVYYVDIEEGKYSILRQCEDVADIFPENCDYEEAMERYIRNLVGPEDRSMIRGFSSIENIRDVLNEEGKSVFCEYQRLFGTALRWIRLEYQATKCVNGKPVSVIMAFRDIHKERETELKHKRELRDALISARLASEAKTRFLSNMSHDIRTPMNAIVGMTAIAQAHMDDMDKVKECLSNIEVSAGHLLRLINEVLDMSHIESGKLSLKCEGFIMDELIESVIFIMTQQFEMRNQNFKLDVSELDRTDVYGDRVRIQQILLNVMSNASKYTQKGGSITLTVSHKPDESDSENKGVYTFVVTDTGRGMSESFIKKIFKPFERENQAEEYEENVEGSGLGMAIAKNIIDLMGGDIDIESRINKGSVVKLTIPLKYNVASVDDAIRELENTDDIYSILKNRKILVVDDNEINCDITCDYLEDVGIITDVAINGKEAFNIISSGEYFDAVLMDVRMPVMNGYEATRRIRELKSEYARTIPIIAMTANAFEEDVQMSKNIGMNAHISKPVSAQLLYETLANVLS